MTGPREHQLYHVHYCTRLLKLYYADTTLLLCIIIQNGGDVIINTIFTISNTININSSSATVTTSTITNANLNDILCYAVLMPILILLPLLALMLY